MGLISQTIKGIAEAIPNTVYFRLSTTQKAEFELSRKALKNKTAIIYGDLPDIPITQNPITISEAYPIKIWFLKLQPEPDTIEIDELLDELKVIAYDFYREFFNDTQSFNNWELTTAIVLSATPTYQIGAEYFSGWQLSITLSIESCLDPTF